MVFNKKKLAEIIIAIAAVYLFTFFIIAPIYNGIYVRSALEKHYPDMEIMSKEEYNGDLGGLFSSSDIEYHYLKYRLYDSKNDISFDQSFSRLRILPFYTFDKNDMEKYAFTLERKEFRQELIETVNNDFAEPLWGFCALNPFDGEYSNGFHIFLPKISSSQMKDLTERLRKFTSEKRNDGAYISYCVYICEDIETFEKIKSADISSAVSNYTGQGYFSDILKPAGISGEEVYFSSDGFDASAYEAGRDEKYSHYIWYYKGEPNANGHERFSLFKAE